VSDGITAAVTGAGRRAVSGTAGTGTVSAGFLLGLVLDEVYLGFGWRGRGRGRDGDLRLVFGPLDQHVNQCLLRVLLDLRYDRGGRGRWSRGLDEDDFVVFLGGSDWLNLGRSDVLLLWWRNVDVDVFLDDGGGRSVVVAGSRRVTGTATGGVAGA